MSTPNDSLRAEVDALVDAKFESVQGLLVPFLQEPGRVFEGDDTVRLSFNSRSKISSDGQLGRVFFDVTGQQGVAAGNRLIRAMSGRLPESDKEVVIEMAKGLNTGRLAMQVAAVELRLKREEQPFGWNDNALADPNSFWAEGLEIDLTRRGLRRKIGARVDFVIAEAGQEEAESTMLTYVLDVNTRFDREVTATSARVMIPPVPTIGNNYISFLEAREIQPRDLSVVSAVWALAGDSISVQADPTEQIADEYQSMVALFEGSRPDQQG